LWSSSARLHEAVHAAEVLELDRELDGARPADQTLRTAPVERRPLEMPLAGSVEESDFDLLDAALRELPGIERVDSARNSLQIRARVLRPETYSTSALGRWNPLSGFGTHHNRILATVTPTHDTGSVTAADDAADLADRDHRIIYL
jgi:hypothetical protein